MRREGRDIACAIVGVSGYTGGVLAELLLGHPAARLAGAFGSARRAEGVRLDGLFPSLRGRVDLAVEAYSAEAVRGCGAEVCFLCTPHEASAEVAPELLGMGLRVFDLSGAFRISEPSAYPAHYGFAHPRPDLLSSRVYGLVELVGAALRGAALVAVPGCYTTSAILPLRPLVEAGSLRPWPRPVIDSTSGVSGAGRSPTMRNLFSEVSQSPYGVPTHRHTPEIVEHSGSEVVFTPHLGPYDRGILTTMHLELADGWDGARLRGVLERRYAGSRFVRVLPAGILPSVGGVRGTNFIDIAVDVDDRGHARVFSALDNLVKGASGQAVQCFNVALGLDEAAGLLAEVRL